MYGTGFVKDKLHKIEYSDETQVLQIELATAQTGAGKLEGQYQINGSETAGEWWSKVYYPAESQTIVAQDSFTVSAISEETNGFMLLMVVLVCGVFYWFMRRRN